MNRSIPGQSSLEFFRNALQSFLASPNSLRVLRSVPSTKSASGTRPSQLFVLDSSFNPPTRAHLGLLSSAIEHLPAETPKRLVLLLATQNADKPAKPVSFERRLRMMESLAHDLLEGLGQDSESSELSVDIGVTKLPFFVDKAAALESADNYSHGSSPDSAPVEQVHLIGYDTLIRVLDTKYYPPKHTLAPLEGLFKRHRLRVTCRTDSGWGDVSEQRRYLEAIRDGQREAEGAKPEWTERIDLVTNPEAEDNTVSSTKARDAAQQGDKAEVQRLCTSRVAGQILDEQMYTPKE